MKTIGIITIHKIFNYGSVLQAYALQCVCERMGFETEIIDYSFPNEFHFKHVQDPHRGSTKEWIIKYFFSLELFKQHKRIELFVKKFQHLSKIQYFSPSELEINPPIYDIYITGSDQVWNPRYCYGDPSFFLSFAPAGSKRISYAASIGTNSLDKEYHHIYSDFLTKYQYVSIRESYSSSLIGKFTKASVEVVADPSLLLSSDDWNRIATHYRIVKKKYILCYFLNYSFNAFPFVQDLSDDIQRNTGYELVWLARPPKRFINPHTSFRIGASPQDFLALVRDSELVLTTSFHGTAFALNYNKPVYSIIESSQAKDTRQKELLESVGLSNRILTLNDRFPSPDHYFDTPDLASSELKKLIIKSLSFLKTALNGE